MPKHDIVRLVRAERRATLALLSGLDPAAFDTPTALPGWRVREVVAHLITTDRAAVLGTILPAVARGTDRLEAWNERQVKRWSDRPVPELLVGLDRWGRRFARVAGALPAPAYRLRMPTAWGRTGAGVMIWVRAYDEWVHRQDVRRALGLGDEEVDLAGVAEFLLATIATATLPQVSGTQGRVTIALEGARVPEWTYDLAAGTAGPGEATDGEPKVIADPPAFIMAAAGRDSFDDLRATGSLRIEGPEGPATALLTKLHIV